jgi:enediyne biosynthesis protein E5
MKMPSIKAQLIIFLSVLALWLSIVNKDVAFLSAISISIIPAVSLNSLIAYLKTKRFKITDSSIISGLIIGYVISAGEPWWKLVSASIFAIGSKHLIRAKGRHLFNPAAFGIFLAAILSSAAAQWKGADLWRIFVPAGIYFVWKIRKLELIAGYILSYLILFASYALIQNSPLFSFDVLKYQNWFFIFIMLIEPKTTPIPRKGKIIFGMAAAVLVFLLTLYGVRFDAELCSLLILNLAVPALNKLS